jgi:glycine dehydrogenase
MPPLTPNILLEVIEMQNIAREAAFEARHIGPWRDDQRAMLAALGVPSVETLMSQTVPGAIRLNGLLDLPEAASEADALAELYATMKQNVVLKSLYGKGYHGVEVPPVIQRNLFENPAWYTAYTPYQAEISQGRLEMLFHFQTLISELTGLPVASASLLDEATAVAEAVGMAYRHSREKRTGIVLAGDVHPQTLDVVVTRAMPIGMSVTSEIDTNTACLIVPWPDTHGVFGDHSAVIAKAKAAGALVVAVADPLALTVLTAPASWGVDICVGSMQRYGVPMGFGGPHAAYLAVTEPLTRLTPGRLVGQSVDAKGRPGYRLALQTREQHIRREKATSNICTAQALLANMAAAFAIWHGPEGLAAIAMRVHRLAARLADAAGVNAAIFDTIKIKVESATAISEAAEKAGYLVCAYDTQHVSITFDQTSTEADLQAIAGILGLKVADEATSLLPATRDASRFLTQPIFHSARSETEMMRLLRKLADKDLALDRTMIPLGSCTMKLNAAAEMMPVSWPETANMHPFAPAHQTKGYQVLVADVERWLCSVTGFAAVSLQPNAGSQGEYAGLLAIRRYHHSRGDHGRTICLIPSSAHGTNPASAHMAGFDVVVTKCTDNGDIDLVDLEEKAKLHAGKLAAVMVTYPSTHGVFEEGISEICRIIHAHGGQVYLDGANLNAIVAVARPGDFGADVCHMNLHKTFCIPHGGGGPGIGPIGVAAHLASFLPGHVAWGTGDAVAAAPYGSASILPITWMYIRMMGAAGLKHATETAILSANYIAHKLEPYYPILYKGDKGRIAHECILDTRVLKDTAGITVDDIAKRLIDYGFHAPTMSWPVSGTLMVEPTESEPKHELDRFCDAMIAIAKEAAQVRDGVWPAGDNPLVNAPHTAADILGDDWTHPYSRSIAAMPDGRAPDSKYWPPVARIDNVHGDRNLVCSCPPIEALAS